jgi:hypothetical protein
MRTWWVLPLSAVVGCVSSVNPDQGKFSCATASDCGEGWECRPQLAGGAMCFKRGSCQDDELCNGQDDDCNGAVDDGFDLRSDSANCGQCARPCADGNRCVDSVCREAACNDGVDNDHDGGTDCEDLACLGRSCASPDGGRCALRRSDGGILDGGADAGVLGCFAE